MALPDIAGLWRNLGFWRGATFASTAAALGLIALLAMTRGDLRTDTMVSPAGSEQSTPHHRVMGHGRQGYRNCAYA